MISENVKEILKKTLGDNYAIEGEVQGGMMNVSYRVKDAKGKSYIIYLPTEQANEMVNRELEKEHQLIAKALGITSKNVYFDTKTGIKINEFIEGVSLDKTNEYDVKKVAKIMHILHSSYLVSKEDYNPFNRFLNEYEKESHTFGFEFPELYKEIRDFVIKHRDYLESQRKVFSHNDAQRSNIIKCEDGKYYFIDFEFVGNNDALYDIAAFGNGEVKDGRELLDAYCDGQPTEDEIKRFYLWRMYISLQWYNVAITKHFRGEGEKHGFNFLDVATHFLTNAKTAYDGYHIEVSDDEVQDDTIRLILMTLDKIRHFLRKDGGDCDFVAFKDGVVYVKMIGACEGCSYANADIKELVEVILQEEVPGVKEVKLAE